METFVWIAWGGVAVALGLGIVAAPLGWRGASRRTWMTHGASAITLALGVALAAHFAVFRGFAPWWRSAVGYLALLGAPPLAAGWAARAMARSGARTGRGRRAVTAFGVAGVFIVVALLGARVATVVLPDLINAVQ
jgi:hypothetical protein